MPSRLSQPADRRDSSGHWTLDGGPPSLPSFLPLADSKQANRFRVDIISQRVETNREINTWGELASAESLKARRGVDPSERPTTTAIWGRARSLARFRHAAAGAGLSGKRREHGAFARSIALPACRRTSHGHNNRSRNYFSGLHGMRVHRGYV